MNTITVNPLTLPSLPLLDRRNLPDCPAVYFVLNGERILYIGKSVNLAQRWAAHHHWSLLSKLDADVRIAWLECSEVELLAEIESALIKQLKPELNGGKRRHLTPSKKVNLTLPDVVYDELEAWAEFQGRPTANLAAYLVESAIREAKESGEFKTLQNDPLATSIAGSKGRGKKGGEE